MKRNLNGGIQGGSGPIGPPMSMWMPPADYAVVQQYQRGEITLEQLREYARKVLRDAKP